jgi:hypothetical protein
MRGAAVMRMGMPPGTAALALGMEVTWPRSDAPGAGNSHKAYGGMGIRGAAQQRMGESEFVLPVEVVHRVTADPSHGRSS